MANWKIFLLWFALMAWRLGSAILLVSQGQEQELILRLNSGFWMGYVFLWAVCLYPQEKANKEEGWGAALYCLAWVFFVGLTGLAIKFLAWVLLRLLFGFEVRVFWGEVFTVIFATICLYIPFWLRRSTVKNQEQI